MINHNKELAKKAVDQVWNQENLSLAREIYTEDYISHSEVGDLHGPGEFLEYLSEFRKAFPDLTFKIKDTIVEDDRTVVRWKARGTHKNDFRGITPTGEMLETTGITIFRIEDGKIAEDWGEWDRMQLMQELGAIPEMEAVR